MRPHTVETVAAIAAQAASHSPRSTAVKKSAIPRSTASAIVMPSAMMHAAPVTAVPSAANTCTATGASAVMSHCTNGASTVFHSVSSSVVTAPRHAVSSFQSGCRCDVLPPLRKAVQNRLAVGGPRLLHARPKPLPDRVQQRQRGLDHRRKRRAELLPYAGCRRGKSLPNRLPRRGERRKKFLQVRPEIRPRAAQALQHALPGCRQAAQVAARCTAAACRGAGGGSCGFLGLRRGLGGLLLLFQRRCFVLRRGGQTVDLVKFCQAAGRFHALCRRSPQRHAQLVHNAARLLPGVAHAPQRRRNFIQRRAQGRRGLLQR